MLTTIARFEFRYLLRNPLMWLTAAFTFVLIVAGTSVEGFELGSEGGLLVNSAYATLRNSLMVSAMFMFVTTSFVANAVIRDDETGYGPIIRSTRITRRDYVLGRFLGAFAIAALCMLLAPLASIAGTAMPWANPELIGPTRIADHLYAYFLIALPNLFIHSAIFFALATITRSMMGTYFGVISFASAFFYLQGSFFDQPRLQKIVALVEPFGATALEHAVRYWTIGERNVLLPAFSGALLYNRLLWTAIAVLSLVLAYTVFRFADQGMSKRERKKQKLEPHASAEETRVFAAASLPAPRHGSAAARALLWMRTRFEIRQVVLSPAFAVLMAWGLYTTFFVLLNQRDPDGRPTYPTTLSMIPEIEDVFRVIPLIVAIYYAGELVWRERDRRVHEIVDASPLPAWAYVVPKTLAMAVVLVSMLLVNVGASIVMQLSLDYAHLELGKYLLWYVLPEAWDMLLLAALAIFVQALSPHKTVGWGIMVLFLMWRELNKIVQHNLLDYGGTPPMPLSDMNAAGSFWHGPWTFRVYWGAFAVLLLLAAHLLWRRGTEIRLRPRLANARRRLAGAPGWVAVAAVLVFAATGAYAYYNTNVLNTYTPNEVKERWAVDFEKKYWKYASLPQPMVAHVTLNVALEPAERKVVTKGRYLLRNTASHDIADVHVRLLYRALDWTSERLSGARLVVDDGKFDYRIYRLDRPMRPGEERVLTFETVRWHRGFPNGSPPTGLVENGTFLDNHEITPFIGMNRAGVLADPATRRKYGLQPDLMQPRKLEDPGATMTPVMGKGWTRSDITVSTSADQTPIAPGKKVSDVTRGGRRIARFVSEAPIHPLFSIQSARYAEKHRRHAGVDLAVYYHRPHAWNVDRMLDALAASLDYYQANFGPYPFDHVRIVEFPGYAYFAQAFAGTVPYSEIFGFIADFEEPETVDHVTGTTAHELAHQYWPHQVVGADAEGQSVLSETLAQYSALMVVKKLLGEDLIRRHLQFELHRYLEGRASSAGNEPVLARVRGEDWVTYRKGALVMYLLQKRMGEEAINRALRTYLQRYKFRGAPYPRTTELIALLRAEAKTAEEQKLITDLFERITLYDMKVTAPTAVRRADGKWDVTVPVEAKKLYADGKGAETETPFDERIEIGLFTAEPGLDVFDAKDVVLMERRPVRTGRQVLHFVTDRKPAFAGVDPYHFYVDRESEDNVVRVR